MLLHDIPKERGPIPQTVYEAMWALYKELRLHRFRWLASQPNAFFVEEYIDRERPTWTFLQEGYWNRRGREILEANRLEKMDISLFHIEIVSTEMEARRV